MQNQIEYVVTSVIDGHSFTNEYHDETRDQVIHNIASGEWDNVTRVLELNITDGAVEDVSKAVIEEAARQLFDEYSGIEEQLPSFGGELDYSWLDDRRHAAELRVA